MKTKIIAFFMMLFLAGCSYVVSEHPVGIENYSVDPNEWNGTWLNEDEIIKIRVTDAAKGIMQLAWIEYHRKELKMESITCQLMKGGEWLYLNVQDFPEADVDGFYFWGRLKKDKRKILFWRPSVSAFQEAAEAKQLDATVKKTKKDGPGGEGVSVRLLGESGKIVDLVENSGGKYFEWDEPIVLIKLVD